VKIPALQIRQTNSRFLYVFGINGKDIEKIAGISRIKKNEFSTIDGYQRTESQKHISGIRKYIDSADPLIPNGIVIAFNESVKFDCDSNNENEYTQFGYLEIPDFDSDSMPPGWIVDGQQRVAACRDANRSEFRLIVSAFIAASEEDQREQFVLVNSAKPLPKSLIFELLPSTHGMLPEKLLRRKLAISLLQKLNLDKNSSLYLQIKTITNPGGRITDNSILRLLEASLSDGYLYKHRDPLTGDGDLEMMTSVISSFFKSIQEVFPEDWELPPSKSRLTHGAGIAAIGNLMDEILLQDESSGLNFDFKSHLDSIKAHCAWSSGAWNSKEGSRISWNDIQNTAQDIRFLSEVLSAIYRNNRKV
jgi:DNA sulfur modification protein DndB